MKIWMSFLAKRTKVYLIEIIRPDDYVLIHGKYMLKMVINFAVVATEISEIQNNDC